MDNSKKLSSIPASALALRLRRFSLIVQEPAKFPGVQIAYPSYRPGEVAAFPVLAKDMTVSGKLAEIVRRRLGLAPDEFWPEW